MAKTCHECGTEILVAETTSCPKCGSTKLDQVIYPKPISVTFEIPAPDVVLRRVGQSVLEAADRLYATNEYSAAVIMAQTACEVIVERAMTKAFTTKGVPDLDEPVTEYLSSYSLANERNRKLYAALTGDDIAKQFFWSDYKQFVKVRNDCVHSGICCDEPSARKGLDAAKELFEHVAKHNGI